MDKSEESSISLDEDSLGFYVHTVKENSLQDKSTSENGEERRFCIQQPIHVIFFITVFIILIAMPVITTVFILYSDDAKNEINVVEDRFVNCRNICRLTLVESIPQNLTYPSGSPSHMSTYQGLINLIDSARSTIEIASFYWTLQSNDVHPSDPSSWEGQQVFDTLYRAGRFRGIQIKIAQNKPSSLYKQQDTVILADQAGAQVRSLDFDKLLGAGILHTKMWLIDRKHFYVGSANLDWRSLTQVKELGGVVQNCSCMAEDMGKIFDVYWYLGDSPSVPAHWPASYSTEINDTHPAEITYNGVPASTFLSSSPAPFCPEGRTVDIDAIVKVIREAKEFVYVAVMDYLPVIVHYNSEPNTFWPVIDNELRRAAYDREVTVRVMGSIWNHTSPAMAAFLRSLADVSRTGQGRIQVRLFRVPVYTEAQAKIPFARVNHNKYMVTERSAYIGTSNWSGDYFVNTGGIGLIVTQPKPEQSYTENLPIRQQLEDVFMRDWKSQYAERVNKTSTSLKYQPLT